MVIFLDLIYKKEYFFPVQFSRPCTSEKNVNLNFTVLIVAVTISADQDDYMFRQVRGLLRK